MASYRRWESASYGGPEGLALTTFVPRPLGPSEVLVTVLTATVTYTDYIVLLGKYTKKFPTPLTPGYDCVARVAALGAKVTSLAVGDLVAAMPEYGCFAGALVLQANACVKLQDATLPLDKAVCAVLTGSTAYQMLHRAVGDRLKAPGASILVHGAAGGTGAMLVALAKVAGLTPDRIFGTCGTKNMAAVRAQGATPLSYNDTAAPWDKELLRLTGGKGVSCVYDAIVSTDSYLKRGLACLARGGKYVAYGLTNSDSPGTIHMPSVIAAFLRMKFQNGVVSCFDGREAEFFHIAERRVILPDEFDQDVRTLMQLVASGQLDPAIGRTWTFEEAPQALEAVKARTALGKHVLVVSQQ